MNDFKNINESINLSIFDSERILKNFFLNTTVEVTFISGDLNIKQTLNISKVTSKGEFIDLVFLELSNFQINTLEFDSVYYYSIGSLVFIFKNGSTLTFRPLDNLKKLKSIID
ncbi:hypothetical protein [Ilyobacter polytropus]|uniref:Uncharacterized protein n=1 Tax=Ilyobacter polytropus (strain ATCC 51220 / DSM 2926 / LMG 16218 / CuHBu1) TaxID=572544 RepID=E3HD68_ILYPC|nr:hypothetical protein [Ilyobacter polytropus]ADO84544.1 hypothetical protein Ilyop_2789 [Ilyobacter polytropus DSM 2926]